MATLCVATGVGKLASVRLCLCKAFAATGISSVAVTKILEPKASTGKRPVFCLIFQRARVYKSGDSIACSRKLATPVYRKQRKRTQEVANAINPPSESSRARFLQSVCSTTPPHSTTLRGTKCSNTWANEEHLLFK